MKLYIKKIIIEKNHKFIESYDFTDFTNTLHKSEELYNIISLCLGMEKAKKHPYAVRFLAIVELEYTYYIRGKKNKGESLFTLSAYKENGLENCFNEYHDLMSQCAESNDVLFFKRFKREDYPHRLLKYKDLLKYYPDGDFGTITNGYGTTRSFRGFIANYIKHFKPVKLLKNRDLYLKLSKDGEFKVGFIDCNEDVPLSEGQKVLYHYLSFISIADFWSRAEKIRNLNRVTKPLIVSDFTEFLDESVNINEVINLSKKAGRQVIFLKK